MSPRVARYARAAAIVVSGMLCQGTTCVRWLPPGELLHRSPEAVWSRFDCDKKPLPFLEVEKNLVIPHTLAPGEEIRHTLIYSLCPASPGQAIPGKLHRRVLFGATTVHDDVVENFLLWPGRWVVTAFIGVPPGAPGGNYTLEVEMENETLGFKRSSEFTVGPAQP